MIEIREATADDGPAIREIFLSCYQHDYPYQQFYDLAHLTKLIYSDDTLMLVAEKDGQVLGTASVILEVGAYSDLVGEFGRLAVRSEARNLGLGKLLMQERLRRVRDRLHVGIIDGRAAHPYSQKIAQAHGFAVVGFAPLKSLMGKRESNVVLAQHFGPALELRRNHPRIIPEVYSIACLAMANAKLSIDVIVDEDAAPYPHTAEFDLEELPAEGYSSLLRIERGRTRRREVFGPTRLHYGIFKIQARNSHYLIARQDTVVVGAVGVTIDPIEKVVRIFELISLNDDVVRFLLAEAERLCRTAWDAFFVEIDVSAHAPRMQRTLLELGFLPIAFVPALSFDEVERIDIVKMARVLGPLELDAVQLGSHAQSMAEAVMRGFSRLYIQPRIAEVVHKVALFEGFTEEQILRVAGCCTLRTFPVGTTIFARNEEARDMFLLLSGTATVFTANTAVGDVSAGECLGEVALLNRSCHSATVQVTSSVEAAALSGNDLFELVRQRPDIGVALYRNLAVGLGQKLQRAGLAQALQSDSDAQRDLA
jgi:predicted N-acetyltransferase YhbS